MSSLIAKWSDSPLSIKVLTGVSILIATVFIVKKLLRPKMCAEKKDLTGKVVVITGGNTGIGYETAKSLAGMGATVIIACRDTQKGNAAVTRLKSQNSNLKVETLQLDLTSFDSIKKFVSDFSQKYGKVDVLINNAGVMGVPKSKTKDGFELQFGTNHLGHFLLTRLLLPYIRKGQNPRIINVSSAAHKMARPTFFNGGIVVDLEDTSGDKRYSNWGRYGQSKACNVLFTVELAKRLKGTGIETFSLHPGVVSTDLINHVSNIVEYVGGSLVNYLFGKTAEQGAQTSIWATISSKLDGKSGAYLSECGIDKATSYSTDPQLASKLWALSCKLTSLPEDI